MIDSKEDILEYLADEEGGALEIDEEILESYDRVKEDIEALSSFPIRLARGLHSKECLDMIRSIVSVVAFSLPLLVLQVLM